MVHRLPIRDFDVEIQLPRDLDKHEAVKIGLWVAALAVDWTDEERAEHKSETREGGGTE
jgi:hypothetical protein